MCAHERLVRARRWGHGSSVVVVLLLLKPFALSKPYTRKPTINPKPRAARARDSSLSPAAEVAPAPLCTGGSFEPLRFSPWSFGASAFMG